MRVPQDHRPPGPDIVNQLIAIYIVEIGSARMLYEQGFAPDCPKGTGWTVDPSRHQLSCPGKRGKRLMLIKGCSRFGQVPDSQEW